jgi:hypothetical protein
VRIIASSLTPLLLSILMTAVDFAYRHSRDAEISRWRSLDKREAERLPWSIYLPPTITARLPWDCRRRLLVLARLMSFITADQKTSPDHHRQWRRLDVLFVGLVGCPVILNGVYPTRSQPQAHVAILGFRCKVAIIAHTQVRSYSFLVLL